MNKPNNLKAILYYENISMLSLAKDTEIPYNAMQGYYADNHIPNVYRAIQIADFLGYTVDEIWGDNCPACVLEAWEDRTGRKRK